MSSSPISPTRLFPLGGLAIVLVCAVYFCEGPERALAADKPRFVSTVKVLSIPKAKLVSTPQKARRKGAFPSFAEAMLAPIYLGSLELQGDEAELSSSEVRRTLNGHLDKIYSSCISKELKRKPIDRMQMQMVIDRKGSVMGASVRPGTKAFERCVVGIVRRIRFAKFSAPRMAIEYKLRIE